MLTFSPLFDILKSTSIQFSRGRAVAARVAHNHKVAGSSPAPATMKRVRPSDGLFSWSWSKDTNRRPAKQVLRRSLRFGRQIRSQKFISRTDAVVRLPCPQP